MGDPLLTADLEDELTSWMSVHDVEAPWDVAALLATAGFSVELCRALESAVPPGALTSALAWIAHTTAVTGLLEQLTDSTNRISALVAPTRSYTQLDRSSAQLTDIPEDFESTLTILSSKLAGITVTRDNDPDRPRIEAFPGELNQVWV